MAPLLGITTVKRFTYRGDSQEEFSNTYHFEAPPPSSSDTWHAWTTSFCAYEKNVLYPDMHIVRAYGYDTDDPKPISVWSYDFALAGEEIAGVLVPPTGQTRMAGDQAALMWAQLDHRNSRGKHLYLRKYMHGGYLDSARPDYVHPTYSDALRTFCNELAGGTIAVAGRWRARAGDWPIITNDANGIVTTRSLKRRGKRPPSPA